MKEFLAITILILSGCWILYVYTGYPLVLKILGWIRPVRLAPSDEYLPSVSVLISARNEEKDIKWKIDETLSWNYPADKLQLLIASDASEDATDQILAGIDDPRFQYVRIEKRGGKNAALNRLFPLSNGEILLFTDANAHMSSDCMRAEIRHFSDPRVGCVTGVGHTCASNQAMGLAIAENAYGSYESRINTLESNIGSVLVCYGSIFAIRRSLFSPLDPDIANDLELPLRIGGQGHYILYEPEARTSEKTTSSPREEFGRRRRICAQGFLGMWRMRSHLRGLRLWQFVSRKLLRWIMLIPLVAFFVGTALLAFRHPVFAAALGVESAFLLLAATGWAVALSGRHPHRIVGIPFYFLLLNLGALVGVVEACLGRRFRVWEVAADSRGDQALYANPMQQPITRKKAASAGDPA